MTSQRPRPAEAGFTLLELMISMVLVAIVLAAVITGFLAQNRLYQGLENGRRTEDNARLALTQMSRMLHLAGAGISPAFAFDMDWYQCGAQGCRDNVATAPWDSGGAAPANLKLHQGTDELVFYARSLHTYIPPDPGDPPGLLGDVWTVDSGTSTDVTLEAHASDKTIIPGNSVLLIACPSAYTYLYATTGIAPVNLDKGAGPVDVTLLGDTTASPFRQNTGTNMASPCIGGGLAKAFLVNRYRFFIADDPSTSRPFLYLDRGIDTTPGGSTIDPPVPVAADIEDLQVAYITRSGTTFGASGANDLSFYAPGSWGGTAATLEGLCDNTNECATCSSSNCPTPYKNGNSQCCPSACSTDIALTSAQGFYQKSALFPCPMDSPQRLANVPGNVVKVRLTVVARSALPAMAHGAVNKQGGDKPVDFSAENHTRTDPPDGYRRVRLSLTVDIPNTSSSAIPII